MQVSDGIIHAIGNTPLIKLKHASELTGCNILGKAEFMNPGQSVKDRAALFIIEDAIKRGQLKNIGSNLKTLHDGMRGLRTEIDFRSDSNWGRQIATIRADMSNGLKSDIDGVPGRVRRLLRQGPDKDVTASSRVDQTEVEETAAMIDFVATCRNFAGELAINEVTLRSFNELQQYVENATEALVESLRTQDLKVRTYRQAQMQAAIRFCDVLFGPDYATLMRKAADIAQNERKSSRAG